jgi:molybdopterin converting factor small subunit
MFDYANGALFTIISKVFSSTYALAISGEPFQVSHEMANMVSITVKFMGIPRQRTGVGRADFNSTQSKLKEVLREVTEFYNVADIMLTEKGEVKPYARVLVNGRSFQFIGGMEAELHQGDSIALIYPWLGHEDF